MCAAPHLTHHPAPELNDSSFSQFSQRSFSGLSFGSWWGPVTAALGTFVPDSGTLNLTQFNDNSYSIGASLYSMAGNAAGPKLQARWWQWMVSTKILDICDNSHVDTLYKFLSEVWMLKQLVSNTVSGSSRQGGKESQGNLRGLFIFSGKKCLPLHSQGKNKQCLPPSPWIRNCHTP